MSRQSESVVFFCKFPPPHTGQTIATDLFGNLLEVKFKVRRIDTSMGFIKPEDFGWRWLKYHGAFAAHFLRQLQRLRKTLRRSDVDTLYLVGSPSVLGLFRNAVTVRAARPHVAQIVAHVHNGNYQEIFKGNIIRSFLSSYVESNIDRFIFTSSLLGRRLESFIPEPKRAVVHNTVSEEVRCTRAEVERKIRKRKARDTFRVLYLSNMIPSKGYLDVGESVTRLQERATMPVQADFIGDWPDARNRRAFLSRVEEWGLQDVVTIHGHITDRRRIRQALLEADAFVLPTYYPNEAQPITIIEAMNAGTPIVSTRHASIPEYVFDGENGYLVDKRAPDQIARALRALMSTDQWAEMAQRARGTYEEMFSPEAVQQQMVDVIAGSTEY